VELILNSIGGASPDINFQVAGTAKAAIVSIAGSDDLRFRTNGNSTDQLIIDSSGHSTFTGNVVANGNIVGDDSTNISQVNNITALGNISGSATSTGSFGAGQFAGNLTPNTDNIYNLGSSTNRWANAHIGDIELSNEGTEGNEVDGTTGSWTIQEGEDDLYLLNRKNGKKYKFKLEEIE